MVCAGWWDVNAKQGVAPAGVVFMSGLVGRVGIAPGYVSQLNWHNRANGRYSEVYILEARSNDGTSV